MDSAEDNKEIAESPNATHENEIVDKPRRRERSPIVKERSIKGIVKWFSVRKGYGFIHVNDDIDDIFVHHSAIVRQTRQPITLIENQEVEFDIVKGIKGLEACCVSGPKGYRVGTSVPNFAYGRGHTGYRRNEGYHPVQQQVDNGGKRVIKAVNNAVTGQEKGSGNDKPNKKRGNFRQRNRGHQRPRKNSDEQHDEVGTEKPQTTDDEENNEKENIEVKKE